MIQPSLEVLFSPGSKDLVRFVIPNHDDEPANRTLSQVIDKAARQRPLILSEAFEELATEFHGDIAVPIQFRPATPNLEGIVLLFVAWNDLIDDQATEILLVSDFVHEPMHY
jgi:hypothetical protein